MEGETNGRLCVPVMEDAREVVLTFKGGRIVEIEAGSGAEALRSWIFSHSGEPGRISHVGIGLNPYLTQPTGWHTIVDEHVHGILFFALGENRYMGGENESSLNADYIIPDATLAVDGKTVVLEGKVVV
jgi:leucyl aminopeptidase (aminopeptidase T)